MILWDWHQSKENQSVYHSPALQSHWEHPNWVQQEHHPFFEPSILPRVSWQGKVAAVGVGEGQAPLLLSACPPHWAQSYSGWKRPLSPIFGCSPPWGVTTEGHGSPWGGGSTRSLSHSAQALFPRGSHNIPTQLVFQEPAALPVRAGGSKKWILGVVCVAVRNVLKARPFASQSKELLSQPDFCRQNKDYYMDKTNFKDFYLNPCPKSTFLIAESATNQRLVLQEFSILEHGMFPDLLSLRQNISLAFQVFPFQYFQHFSCIN